MLRLNLKAEPTWLEMAPGVRFLLSPCTASVLGAARESDAVQGLFADGAVPGETALTVALAKEVGKATILDWEGVGDDKGQPLAVTPEAIEACLEVPVIFQKFQIEHVGRGLMLVEEKNGSAPSPTGTSAAAGNTARPARAAAKSARAKSTTRKR